MNINWIVEIMFRDDGEWWQEDSLPHQNGPPIYPSKGDAIAAGARLRLLHPGIVRIRVCIKESLDMKYRDDMNDKEVAQMLAEIAAIDKCYAEAKALEEKARAAMTPEQIEEAIEEIEGHLDYFNKYIAGDRK